MPAPKNTEPRSRKNGHHAVELLRIFAILGVIWFHITGLPFRVAAFSGLLVFVILTTVFSRAADPNASLGDFLRKRARRLLLPWLFWYLIYAVMNLIIGRPAIIYSHDLFSSVLVGPWIGLWYLPFAFVVSALSFIYHRATKAVNPRISLFAALAVGTVLLGSAQFVRHDGALFSPWGQWLHALPAIAFGFAISAFLSGKKSWWEVTAIVATPVLYVAISRFADQGLAVTYLIAVPLTAFAFLSAVELPKWVMTLSSLGMGVYVLHGGLISVLNRILPSLTSPYVLFVLTVLFAFAGAFLLKRVRLIKEMV